MFFHIRERLRLWREMRAARASHALLYRRLEHLEAARALRELEAEVQRSLAGLHRVHGHGANGPVIDLTAEVIEPFPVPTERSRHG